MTSALAFSPDGALLAAGGSGHAITLWDVATQQFSGSPMMGHSYWVSALQFSPDGKTLASGSWDDSLLLWDAASRQPLGSPMTGHAGDLLQLSFSPDGQQLVSADINGTLMIWDTRSQFSGSPLGEALPPARAIFIWTHAFSPDGKILAYSADSRIYLWDLEKNQPLGEPLQGHPDDVRSLVFPAQDKGRTLISADRSHVVIAWDVASGKPLWQTGKDQPNQPEYLASYAKVDLSPDGRWLAVAGCSQKQASDCLESELWLQDTSTGEMAQQPLEIEGSISFVRFSHSGALLALSSGDQAIIWDVTSQEIVYKFQAGKLDLDALAFSPDDNAAGDEKLT